VVPARQLAGCTLVQEEASGVRGGGSGDRARRLRRGSRRRNRCRTSSSTAPLGSNSTRCPRGSSSSRSPPGSTWPFRCLFLVVDGTYRWRCGVVGERESLTPHWGSMTTWGRAGRGRAAHNRLWSCTLLRAIIIESSQWSEELESEEVSQESSTEPLTELRFARECQLPCAVFDQPLGGARGLHSRQREVSK
jgi:hypothetical protein